MAPALLGQMQAVMNQLQAAVNEVGLACPATVFSYSVDLAFGWSLVVPLILNTWAD
jgi:hypothetical protein